MSATVERNGVDAGPSHRSDLARSAARSHFRMRLSRTITKNLPYLLLTILVAVPCFWQPHIQAGDLSSHLYSAWLVSKVSAGELPGLYVVPQFTNVLFDHLLSILWKTGSVVFTERVAVLIAVQVFFWGCLAFISAVAGRRTWDLTPFLLILAFGAVFRMGFFNFYISVGLCAGALSLVWRNKRGIRLLAAPLLAAAYVAHILPVMWGLAVIAYILIARSLAETKLFRLTVIVLMGLVATSILLATRVPTRWAPGVRIDSLIGLDQALIFGMKYKAVAVSLLILWILRLIRRFESGPSWRSDIALHLSMLGAASTLLMPDAILLPFYRGGLTYVTIRLSLLSAILFCAMIGSGSRNPLERALSIALAVMFFSLAYIDERKLNGMERQMATAVHTLPSGARVVATLRDSRLAVPALEHMIDRVCIGRCYHFAAYEPATTQFRLRAEPGNPYVMTDIDDVLALEHSEYVWQRRDVELFRLYPCQGGKQICASSVSPGTRLIKLDLSDTRAQAQAQ
jgi:hypothetical protein